MPLRRSIKVDDEVYERLQQLAKELGVDSPNQVLRKLLLDGVGPRPVPSISNSFAKRFFQCLESTRIDFVSTVSCAAWARAIEELGTRPVVIGIDTRSFAYEIVIVRSLEDPVAYVCMHGHRGFGDPERKVLNRCELLGLLLGVREILEGRDPLRTYGYGCRMSRYGEYVVLECFRDDEWVGPRHVLLMVLEKVLDSVPRIEKVFEIEGYRVRRVITSHHHAFVGFLPLQCVPTALYIVGEPSWIRLGIELCNAWSGSFGGTVKLEVEIEDRSTKTTLVRELAKIFGRSREYGVKRHRKSVSAEAPLPIVLQSLGLDLELDPKIEDLNQTVEKIDVLAATILKRIFSRVGVTPSKRRA